jgi:hypothetical protein
MLPKSERRVTRARERRIGKLVARGKVINYSVKKYRRKHRWQRDNCFSAGDYVEYRYSSLFIFFFSFFVDVGRKKVFVSTEAFGWSFRKLLVKESKRALASRIPFEKNTMPHAGSQTYHFTDTCLAAEG